MSVNAVSQRSIAVVLLALFLGMSFLQLESCGLSKQRLQKWLATPTNSVMVRPNTSHSIKAVTPMLEQNCSAKRRSSNRCSDDVVRCIGDRMVFNSNDNTGSLGCWRGIQYRQPKCRPDACWPTRVMHSMPMAWMRTSIHPAQHGLTTAPMRSVNPTLQFNGCTLLSTTKTQSELT